MKKLLFAAGLVLAATSASMAQAYVYGPPYRGSAAYDYSAGSGLYDYAPGYSYGGNWYDDERSDGPGSGNSAESQR